MMRGIIICPDSELGQILKQTLTDSRTVNVLRTLDYYPEEESLMRLVRANAPQVLFLSTESLHKTGDLVSVIEQEAPGLQIVAVSRTCEPAVLLDVMRFGIREFLSLPLNTATVISCLQRVQAIASTRPAIVESSDCVFAFLPSKAGVGTSTVAVNTAMALARHPHTPGLLLDMDLSSGIIGFMLKLHNAHAITEAAEHAHQLDESIWPQLVTSVSGVDVIHSGRFAPGFRIEAAQIRHILEFARRHYKTICVDLSGNLERYSLDVMQEAKCIFLVVTPEVPALHLAREKMRFLSGFECADRVRILLNRTHKRSVVSAAQVEELLEAPIMHSFMNDYLGVHRALEAGRSVDPNSELGKQFDVMSCTILDKKTHDLDTKKRFVEYFSVLPTRYSSLGDKKTAS